MKELCEIIGGLIVFGVASILGLCVYVAAIILATLHITIPILFILLVFNWCTS